ncbi:hypothetical protein JOJ86_006036 [Rhodococcus percolatus]|uniref:AAA family ATPase n=1 Tax=Rhodococcus opacus TaxID=37919 RepID=UPI0015FE5E51|nr:AAA family ATPase [Rhodococcus opacus]MBA8964758.1 hypothetical protein [Rhodococcus opacus]MBP2208310.1 hypothetical protein [Rhodococcus opacus]
MTSLHSEGPIEPALAIVTGAWLDAQEFPPLRWFVHGILAEGLTILAGAPKLGKSWLTLAIAMAVASGSNALGCIPTGKPRPVLLLALEDGYRRLQGRARHLLGEGGAIPVNLHIVIKGTNLQLMTALADWLEEHRHDQPLVIIDTLAKIRPASSSGKESYSSDYNYVGSLKNMIDEIPGGAMVLVHHTRKAESVDFLEAVSGTQGISGAADCTIVLARPRNQDGGVLHVTGRDVPESEYAMTSDNGRWTLDGDSLAKAAAAATERKTTSEVGDRSAEIIAYVANHPEGVTPSQVDLALNLTDSRVYLPRLVKSGRIAKLKRGQYAPVTSVSSVTSEGNETLETEVTPPLTGVWRVSGDPVLNPAA